MFVGLWLLVAVLIVRLVVKRIGPLFSLLRPSSMKDPEKVAAAIEQLLPMMKSKTVAPQGAKAMRKQLAKKLHVRAEMIFSYTVRGQLASYGVSSESIQVVEQILRRGETEQYGYTPPAAQEMSLRDILKASREIEERLPKH